MPEQDMDIQGMLGKAKKLHPNQLAIVDESGTVSAHTIPKPETADSLVIPEVDGFTALTPGSLLLPKSGELAHGLVTPSGVKVEDATKTILTKEAGSLVVPEPVLMPVSEKTSLPGIKIGHVSGEDEEIKQRERQSESDISALEKSATQFVADKIRVLIGAKFTQEPARSQFNQALEFLRNTNGAAPFNDTDSEVLDQILLTGLTICGDPYTLTLDNTLRHRGVKQSPLVSALSAMKDLAREKQGKLPAVKAKILGGTFVENFARSKAQRYALYEMFPHLQLDVHEKIKLLEQMEIYGDYRSNTAAAEFALSAYQEMPESSWVVAQENRRLQLKLAMAGMAPQELYSNYEELLRQSEKIVFSSDPRVALQESKIGMEVEGIYRDHAKHDELAPESWETGSDVLGADIIEIRKAGKGVPFDAKFRKDIIDAWRWGQDHFKGNPQDSWTVHFHLDKQVHPNKPTVDGLYSSMVVTDRKGLPTHEVRGVIPPRSPAEMIAAIELFIASSKGEASLQAPVTISEQPASWQQAVWGSIVSKDNSSEATTAALFALRDPQALRAFDVAPLIDTFGTAFLDNPEPVIVLASDQGNEFIKACITEGHPLKPDHITRMLRTESYRTKKQATKVRANLITILEDAPITDVFLAPLISERLTDSSEDEHVRLAATKALIHREPAETRQKILDLLEAQNENSNFKSSIVEIVAKENGEFVKSLFADKSRAPEQRRIILWGLMKSKVLADSTKDYLKNIVSDPEETSIVSEYALASLPFYSPDADSRAVMFDYLRKHSEDPSLAYTVIGNMESVLEEPDVNEFVIYLLERIVDKREDPAINSIVEYLIPFVAAQAEYTRVRSILEKLLSDDDMYLKGIAISSLERFASEDPALDLKLLEAKAKLNSYADDILNSLPEADFIPPGIR